MIPLIIIIGLTAPLTIVTPIGPRNFFLIYTLEIIEVLYILNETKLNLDKYKCLLLIPNILIFVFYVGIYSYISYVSLERDKYVTYVSNETTKQGVEVPILPFSKFVHFANYGNDIYWKKVYVDYLGVRDDLYFIYVPYEKWNNKHDVNK